MRFPSLTSSYRFRISSPETFSSPQASKTFARNHDNTFQARERDDPAAFLLRPVHRRRRHRASLGTVRGMSLFFANLFAAGGAPFFGFLHDPMGSYNLSFTLFSCALFTSAFLILLATPPHRQSTGPKRQSRNGFNQLLQTTLPA